MKHISLYILFAIAPLFLHSKDVGTAVTVGKWELSTGETLELRLLNEVHHGLYAGNSLLHETPPDYFVTQAVQSKNKSIALFSVYSTKPNQAGFWYAYIVSVDTSRGKIEVSEVMKTKELDDIGGRDRRVSKIGSIDSYPQVELHMLYAEKVSLPSAMIREWQRWDIQTKKYITSLEKDAVALNMSEFTMYMTDSVRVRKIISPQQ